FFNQQPANRSPRGWGGLVFVKNTLSLIWGAGAALSGGGPADRKILFIQTVPAVLALIALALG
ncbi:hypothetical protein NKH00_31590, partial [Mesorhizobium sp. M1405]